MCIHFLMKTRDDLHASINFNYIPNLICKPQRNPADIA